MVETSEQTLTVGWRERFDATLRAAVDAIVIIDEKGTIETLNPAAERMFGFRLEELEGRNVSVLMPEPWASQHDDYIRRYVESGISKAVGIGREVTGQRKDGTRFPIEISVGDGSFGGQRFFVGLVRDISERKQMEEELRDREETLRQTQARAPIPTATTDLEGHLLEANAACQAMFGYTPEECCEIGLLGITHPDDRSATTELLQRLVGGEIESLEREQRFVAQDGRILDGILHVGAVRDAQDRPLRLVVQIIDRTRQLQAEERARETQERLAHINRLGTLGEMAAGIAHEVNQPLGAISNYAQACRLMLRAGTDDRDRFSDILEKIGDQAQRAGEVIRRLRKLAKGETAIRNVVDVNEVVQEVVTLAEADARWRGFDIRLDLGRNLPRAELDVVQIQQVILNLLRNGMEAMRDGNSALAEVQLRTRLLDEDEIEIAVRDYGPGVDPKVAGDVMSPFVTTKSTGMGMGLAICQSIVASHGGRLWFDSKPMGGTTFHFTIPAESTGERRAAG